MRQEVIRGQQRAGLLPAALLALALVSAMGSTAATPAETSTVHEVRLTEVDDVYVADAVIEAVRQATVAAQIPGIVTQIFVDAGDVVRKGQLLARIDTREADARVAAGRAGVAQADARLAQATLERERARSLLAQNFVSKAALDKAESDYLAASAAADAARADSSQSATARSYAELKSPMDGVVTRRLLEPGEMASPGVGVVQLHDPAALRATGYLPQGQLARAAQARKARIELQQLARGFDAQRVTILPASDARLLATQIRADLPTGEIPGLLPGAAAKIVLVVGRERRLVIPEAALIRRGELVAVNVVNADGRPQLRQVRLGISVADGSVEVLAGLAEGERLRLNPLAIAAQKPAAGSVSATAMPAAAQPAGKAPGRP